MSISIRDLINKYVYILKKHNTIYGTIRVTTNSIKK
jgi:hypothetical protein